MIHKRKVRLSEAACKVQRRHSQRERRAGHTGGRLKGKFTRNVCIFGRVYMNRWMWWMFWPKTWS